MTSDEQKEAEDTYYHEDEDGDRGGGMVRRMGVGMRMRRAGSAGLATSERL